MAVFFLPLVLSGLAPRCDFTYDMLKPSPARLVRAGSGELCLFSWGRVSSTSGLVCPPNRSVIDLEVCSSPYAPFFSFPSNPGFAGLV